MWTKKVKSYIDAVVPTIKAKNLSSHPWIDSSIKLLSNRKESTRRKAKTANTDQLWMKYRQYRNLLKNCDFRQI